MRIPCDTIARLSHLLPAPDAEIDEAFRCFRLESGMVMVTDRRYMAIEEVEPFEGTFYIRGDAALIEQCRIEAQFSSVIDFSPVPQLKYTTAITTMGFRVSENIGYWPEHQSEYDNWRAAVMEPCKTPLTETSGPMTFELAGLTRLAQAAPSGVITLEKHVDPGNRPTCVRDADTHSWVGFFNPNVKDGRPHPAATVPGWCK